jgi:hypothetical protein
VLHVPLLKEAVDQKRLTLAAESLRRRSGSVFFLSVFSNVNILCTPLYRMKWAVHMALPSKCYELRSRDSSITKTELDAKNYIPIIHLFLKLIIKRCITSSTLPLVSCTMV